MALYDLIVRTKSIEWTNSGAEVTYKEATYYNVPEQFVNSFRTMYPEAVVLVQEAGSSEKEFKRFAKAMQKGFDDPISPEEGEEIREEIVKRYSSGYEDVINKMMESEFV